MNNLKHTPAPWSEPIFDGDSDGFVIENIPVWIDKDAENAEANAKLICAAPELLEALQNLNIAIDNYWNSNTKPDSLVKIITKNQQASLSIIKKLTK